MFYTKSLSWISAFLACLFSGLFVQPGFGQDRPDKSSSETDRVRFASGLTIPPAPSDLQIFMLSSQKPPADFVRELLPSVAPESNGLQSLGESEFLRERHITPKKEMLGAFQGKHVAVLLDPKSGDVQVFPSLDLLKPVPTQSRHE